MLQKFFCLHVDTAALMAGWLGILGSFASVLFFGLCLGFVDDINEKIIDLTSKSNENADDSRTLLVLIFMGYLVVNAVNMAVSFALLLGTYKAKQIFILPWLANSAMVFPMHFLTYIVLVEQTMQMSPTTGYLSLIFGGIGLVLYIYLWLAIFSLYKIIKGARDEQKVPQKQQQQQKVPLCQENRPTSTKA